VQPLAQPPLDKPGATRGPDGRRRVTRRGFLAMAVAGVGALGAAGIVAALGGSPKPAPSPEPSPTVGLAAALGLSPTATATPAPPEATPTAAPAPSATGQPEMGMGKKSPLEAFLEPLIKEAQARRRERRAGDPTGYDRRIDQRLNQDRVNVLLFGYGVTYESRDGAIIGSHTVVSINTRTTTVDVVSLTHDVLAPEIERYHRARGEVMKGTKIDGAYATGGFDLQRLVVEDATGFSVDFQLNVDELFVKHLVDTSFGKIEVDNPQDFDALPFILEGQTYGEKHFPKGKLELDGFEAMRYMKALSKAYDRKIERNVRKHLVFRALAEAVEAHHTSPLWLVVTGGLLASEIKDGRLRGDFQIDDLVLKNLGTIAEIVRSRAASGASREPVVPRFDTSLYVVNPLAGDGGVWWIWEEAMVNNPRLLADLRGGAYPDEAIEIPVGGDPDAPDLVGHYWRSVRALVEKTVPHQTEPERTNHV